jgi:hypothetical protein
VCGCWSDALVALRSQQRRWSSNAPERLAGLLKLYVAEDSAEEREQLMRYQLLSALAGTEVEAATRSADHAVLMLHDFGTDQRPSRQDGAVRKRLPRFATAVSDCEAPGAQQVCGRLQPANGRIGWHRRCNTTTAFLKESTMAQSTTAPGSSSLPSPDKAHMLTSPWNSFGQRFDSLTVWGRPARFPVVNERAVRATAGIVMALATIAIAIAYFDKNYTPVRIISVFVSADFALRQVAGLTPLSPIGTLGTLLVRNQTPEWVGATQKRFSWALAFSMVLVIAILTNAGVRGVGIPLIGLALIGLLWLESVVGFCVGCFIYSRLIKADLLHPQDAPACGGNSCQIAAPAAAR